MSCSTLILLLHHSYRFQIYNVHCSEAPFCFFNFSEWSSRNPRRKQENKVTILVYSSHGKPFWIWRNGAKSRSYVICQNEDKFTPNLHPCQTQMSWEWNYHGLWSALVCIFQYNIFTNFVNLSLKFRETFCMEKLFLKLQNTIWWSILIKCLFLWGKNLEIFYTRFVIEFSMYRD